MKILKFFLKTAVKLQQQKNENVNLQEAKQLKSVLINLD